MRTKAEVLQHFDNLADGGFWAGLYERGGDAVTKYSFVARQALVEGMLDSVIRCGDHILDVACGTGVMAPFILKRGARYSGIDLSHRMIEQADLRIDGPAEFRVGDVYNLPYADVVFDVVLALGLFEYLEDIESAAREMVAATKPGGSIIVSVPNALCLDALTSRMFSPLVSPVVRLVRRAERATPKPNRFFHRKFRPGNIDRVFSSLGCRRAGAGLYNVEVACYPLRRLLPMASLRLKKRFERSSGAMARIFATAYVGRFIKVNAIKGDVGG